jgi:hypothetical protein
VILAMVEQNQSRESLFCIDDGTEKLPSLVTGKYNKPYCSSNVKKLPTKYRVNSNSWMTAATVEGFFVQMDHQTRAKK